MQPVCKLYKPCLVASMRKQFINILFIGQSLSAGKPLYIIRNADSKHIPQLFLRYLCIFQDIVKQCRYQQFIILHSVFLNDVIYSHQMSFKIRDIPSIRKCPLLTLMCLFCKIHRKSNQIYLFSDNYGFLSLLNPDSVVYNQKCSDQHENCRQQLGYRYSRTANLKLIGPQPFDKESSCRIRSDIP